MSLHRTVAILGLFAGLIPAQPAPDAADEVRTRQIWNEKFREKRPAPSTSRKKSASKVPGTVPSADIGDSLVGITIWREEGPDWKRIAADSPLTEGQRIRIGIETGRTGYLYVINREQYAGGALGDPVLIFPTLRIHSGDNQVRGGRVVEIPAAADSPPHFTLTRSRPDHVAEMLVLLVTPQPLPGVKIGTEAVKLSADQMAAWEREWTRTVRRLEARGEAGKRYGAAEREAGTQTRMLQHDDPLPQTLFLCEAKQNEPLLVSVPLRIAK